MKSSGLASNLQPSGAKADALREEMEEAANRVEICRVLGLLLAQGRLWAPSPWGKLQPLLSPCSASSFPPLRVLPPPLAAPQRQWLWVMLPSQAGCPQLLCPHPPHPRELEGLPFPGNTSWQSSAPILALVGTFLNLLCAGFISIIFKH